MPTTIVKSHSDACNLVRLAISRIGGLVLEYKTGALKDEHGRLIRFGSPGASDLIACIGGRFVAIEVKVGADRWRPEQQRFAAAVKAAGGLHVVARFSEVEDGVETLRAAMSCQECKQTLTRENSVAPALLCWNCGLIEVARSC
jgi:hypothetical protein